MVVLLAGLFRLDEVWLPLVMGRWSRSDRRALAVTLADPAAVRRARELSGGAPWRGGDA